MKKYVLLFTLGLSLSAIFGQATLIGTTSYDVQTNDASKSRLNIYDDGTMSALWTGSQDFSGALTFADRGMFYNHFDGTSWSALPTLRVEGERTGFGNVIRVGDHEVVVAHNGTAQITLYANSAVGNTDWTQLGGSLQIRGYWPVACSPAGSDTIYVVNADSILPTSLHFSRSDDGGATWAILNDTVPFLTEADGFNPFSFESAADQYEIAVHGADVYVLYGMTSSDVVLLHSDNFGEAGSWESTTIVDFPLPDYYYTFIDIDGDGITDTIPANDATYDMVMEDDGTLDVMAGYYALHDYSTIDWNNMYFWYWKTGMDSARRIDLTLDWNNDDGLNNPYAGIGYSHYLYRNAGNCSSPAMAWDPATGRIYCVYPMPIEYTDDYGDPTNLSAQSRRDLFGIFTDDGKEWSLPVNLTNTAESGKENFYVFSNKRIVDDKIHAIWQVDAEPGTAITDGDLVDTNYIYYDAWGLGDLGPLAEYSFVIGASLDVTFTNLSDNAVSYAWDFGDGFTSTETDPVHVYDASGTYTVCLSATNALGTDTYCAQVTVVAPPVVDFSYAGDPDVTFTDLSTNTPDNWSWDFGDGGTSTEENPVHTYAANGTYNVCLTAGNAAGSDSHCEDVTISSIVSAPLADFTYTAVNLEVTFTDASTNVPDTWNWSFGDGMSSPDQNPVHDFADAGAYTVCLTASNIAGDDTQCKVIEVSTGIQNSFADAISVFPNPAGNALYVDFGNIATQEIRGIALYDLTGREIPVPVNNGSGSTWTLHLDNVPAGNYCVRITTDEGPINKEIIKE